MRRFTLACMGVLLVAGAAAVAWLALSSAVRQTQPPRQVDSPSRGAPVERLAVAGTGSLSRSERSAMLEAGINPDHAEIERRYWRISEELAAMLRGRSQDEQRELVHALSIALGDLGDVSHTGNGAMMRLAVAIEASRMERADMARPLFQQVADDVTASVTFRAWALRELSESHFRDVLRHPERADDVDAAIAAREQALRIIESSSEADFVSTMGLRSMELERALFELAQSHGARAGLRTDGAGADFAQSAELLERLITELPEQLPGWEMPQSKYQAAVNWQLAGEHERAVQWFDALIADHADYGAGDGRQVAFRLDRIASLRQYAPPETVLAELELIVADAAASAFAASLSARQQLAEVYESTGHVEIAIAHYLEAARIAADPSVVFRDANQSNAAHRREVIAAASTLEAARLLAASGDFNGSLVQYAAFVDQFPRDPNVGYAQRQIERLTARTTP